MGLVFAMMAFVPRGGIFLINLAPISVVQPCAPHLGDLQNPTKDHKSSIARVGSDIHMVIAD